MIEVTDFGLTEPKKPTGSLGVINAADSLRPSVMELSHLLVTEFTEPRQE